MELAVKDIQSLFLYCILISQKVFINSFCTSRFPHKSVNLFFKSVMIKDELTDLCGNEPLQNDVINTYCEINFLL